jgi:hypothetical protein
MKASFTPILIFIFCFLYFGSPSIAQQTENQEEQMKDWLAGNWEFQGLQYPVGAGAKERKFIDSINERNRGSVLSCTVWGNCHISQIINGEKRTFRPIILKKGEKGFYLDMQGSHAYFRDISANSMKLFAEKKPIISMKRIGKMLPPLPPEKNRKIPDPPPKN